MLVIKVAGANRSIYQLGTLNFINNVFQLLSASETKKYACMIHALHQKLDLLVIKYWKQITTRRIDKILLYMTRDVKAFVIFDT